MRNETIVDECVCYIEYALIAVKRLTVPYGNGAKNLSIARAVSDTTNKQAAPARIILRISVLFWNENLCD